MIFSISRIQKKGKQKRLKSLFCFPFFVCDEIITIYFQEYKTEKKNGQFSFPFFAMLTPK